MGEFVHFPSTLWTTIAQRPEEARAKVFARYQQPILAYLKKRVKNEHLAEDLLQEVFKDVCTTEFLTKADQAKGKFRTLLLSVAEHKISHARDKEKRRRAVSIEQGGKDDGPAVLPAAPTESDESAFNQLWEDHILTLARGRLQKESVPGKPRYYEAHVLDFIQRLSCKESAAKLGVPESTVNNWVHVARQKIIQYARELAQEYSSTEDEFKEEVALVLRKLPPDPAF